MSLVILGKVSRKSSKNRLEADILSTPPAALTQRATPRQTRDREVGVGNWKTEREMEEVSY
jgi:hypothetical protein